MIHARIPIALLGVALVLPASLAHANVVYEILDTTNVLQSKEKADGSIGNQGNWVDVVGPTGGRGNGNFGFDTHSLVIELDTTDKLVIVRARTNFPAPGVALDGYPDYFMADIFFDLHRTGTNTGFTYAINTGYDYTANPNPALPPERSAVLASPSFQMATNAADPFWTSLDLFPNDEVAGWWSDTCMGVPAGPDCNPPPPTDEARLIPVEIKGTTVAGTSVTYSQMGGLFQTHGYRREYSWTISGLDDALFSEFVDGFAVLWGTANCGNDVIHGVVPVPAALPLFLTALAGLGVAGWRRRRG